MLLQNYIFFGHKYGPIIYIYDKLSLTKISSYRLFRGVGITDMAMFAPDIQPQATSK